MVDARGYSCPTPVLMTQQALAKSPDALTVLVDNRTAVENITRFAEGRGYRVAVVSDGGDFSLKLSK